MRKSGNLLSASLSEGDAAALRPLEAARAVPHDQIAALHSNKLAISETLPTVSVWFRKTGAAPKRRLI
jgi:hypothetical protein